MTQTLTPAPPKKQAPPKKDRHWADKLTRSGFFLGALLLHLIIFLMVATWVIWQPFIPPTDDFKPTYVQHSSPPPPPPPQQQQVTVSTHVLAPPTPVISTSNPVVNFNIPMPDFTHQTTPEDVTQKLTQKVAAPSANMSDVRLASIKTTEAGWGRDPNNIRDSDSDPRNVVAKFPIYLASYADGDWGCNVQIGDDGKIVAGSLPNLAAKINEWSHGHITAMVVPDPLDLGGSELLDKKPPFIFFTGHKDFVLTDQEVQNLREYLQVGGMIWGDNSLAGRGSRFDIAFRREMKRVVPDEDKQFEPVPLTDDIYTKSWFPLTQVPEGMNYYAEPLEHLDIDGKLAILYTPNDYGDLFWMLILPGDTDVGSWSPSKTSMLHTNREFSTHEVFYRNFQLDSCLAAQKLGMNIVGYALVRFDKDLQLAP